MQDNIDAHEKAHEKMALILWDPKPAFVLLRSLEYGSRFYTTNSRHNGDPRYLANGKLAYEIIGYAETTEEAERKLGER